MPALLQLEVITQEKVTLKDQIDILIAPGYNGQISILPGHCNLLTRLTAGEMFILKGPSSTILAITGGFLDIHNNKITVMADSAVRADEIDIQKVETAKQKAEDALKQKLSKKEFAVASADLRRAVLELKVAKRKRAYKPHPQSQ